MFGASCGEAINHANLTKELGKILERSCDLERPGRANVKTRFERNGRGERKEHKNLQIPIQNEHVAAKTTAKRYFHFHTKHKVR